jgi:hypothetical protein
MLRDSVLLILIGIFIVCLPKALDNLETMIRRTNEYGPDKGSAE